MTNENDLLERAPEPPPPTPPGLLERFRLPVPPDPIRPKVFWPAVVLAGIAGDLMLRVGYETVAGSLTAVAIIVVVASQRNRLSRLDWSALILAAALSLVLCLRTSDWVTFPALMTATGLTFLAGTDRVGGGRQPWLTGALRSVESFARSFRWLSATSEKAGRRAGLSAVSVVRAVALAGGLGLVIVALLASADAVVASLLSIARVASGFAHLVGVTMGVIGAIGIGFVSRLSTPAEPGVASSKTRFALEANTVVVTMAAVLGAWSILQVSVALGAADHILETEGLTVAEYARQGFFQLVAVAAIVLGTLRLAGSVSALPRNPEGRLFRIASAVIGVALLVLIGSSFLRLWYYVGEFGLTMLRLSVAWFLAWLAFFSVVVIARATGSSWADRWSHTISALSVGAFVLAFAVVNPEALVVRHNLARDQVDGLYLADSMSGDGRSEIQSSTSPAAVDLRPIVCEFPQQSSYGFLSWNMGNPDC